MDTCAICGATGRFARYRLREMLIGTRELYDYLECPDCGTLAIERVPDDLGRHYPTGYNAGLVKEEAAGIPTGLRRRAELVRNGYDLFGRGRLAQRILRRWTPPRSRALRIATPTARAAGLRSFDDPILDVGCGTVAVNLDRLRIAGFRRLLGIDPFLPGDTTYRGISLRKASIEDIDGTFRLITFNHSFEHVPDPHGTLASAAARLVPGGSIVIRMPVMGTALWRTYGADWLELDAPRHLFIYTPQAVDVIAKAHRLRVTRVIWEGTGFGFAASEQVRRDIAVFEPASYLVEPPGVFEWAQLAAWDAAAERLNEAADGGRAAYFLRAD